MALSYCVRLAWTLPFSRHPRRWRLSMAYMAGRLDLTLCRSNCWDDRTRKRLYNRNWAAQVAGTHPSDERRETLTRADGPTPTDRMLYLIIKHILPGDYLAKVDVGTMAHSLEARSPFLDHELMEFAATIPTAQLLAGGERKHILKKYAATRVPRKAIYRRKAGFAVPIDQFARRRDGSMRLVEPGTHEERLAAVRFLGQVADHLVGHDLAGVALDSAHRFAVANEVGRIAVAGRGISLRA